MRRSSNPAPAGQRRVPPSDRTAPFPPDFLILGAQKCGTTAMAAALRSHPDVFVPLAKEAYHFGKVADDEVGGDSYRRFFSGWSGQPVVGEATPDYMVLEGSADQICRFLPEVKGIVLLRNPVDRAYSAFWNGQRIGRVDGTFSEAIESELSGAGPHDRWFHDLVERGHYAEQLQRFFDSGFDRSRLLVILFEEMVADEAAVLRSVQDFLGLEPVVTAIPKENQASSSWLPRRVRRALSPHFRATWARVIVRLSRRSFRPPAMAPEVRARLVDHYRPHNARLAELLGRDLPDWDR